MWGPPPYDPPEDSPEEKLAKALHEYGREPVEKGQVVKQSIEFTCVPCGHVFHQGEAITFERRHELGSERREFIEKRYGGNPRLFLCPACLEGWVVARPTSGKVEKFLSWDEISEPAREGRRSQARQLMADYVMLTKDEFRHVASLLDDSVAFAEETDINSALEEVEKARRLMKRCLE